MIGFVIFARLLITLIWREFAFFNRWLH
jgi:hypothetical protein